MALIARKNSKWMKVVLLTGLLCLTQFTSNVDARKTASSSSRRGSSSSSSRKQPSQAQQQAHADVAKLSYSNYNAKPAVATPPKHVAPVSHPQPSAPVQQPNANSQPIGWNVPKKDAPVSNSAPYPTNNNYGGATNTHNTHNQAPPPYSQYPNNGPPPAYTPHGSPAGGSNFNQAPPPYSAGNQGFQPGAQPGYAHQPAAGYPQQPAAGYPQQPVGGYAHQPVGGYPQQSGGYLSGGQPGGYPQQPGGFGGQPGLAVPGGYAQPGYGAQPNYYPQKSSGSGLQTALIAGVGGLALYGALKPSETKVIYVNNGTSQDPAPVQPDTAASPGALPATPCVEGNCTPTPLAPLPNMEMPMNGSTPLAGADMNGTTMMANPNMYMSTPPLAVDPMTGTTMYQGQPPAGTDPATMTTLQQQQQQQQMSTDPAAGTPMGAVTGAGMTSQMSTGQTESLPQSPISSDTTASVTATPAFSQSTGSLNSYSPLGVEQRLDVPVNQTLQSSHPIPANAPQTDNGAGTIKYTTAILIPIISLILLS